MKNSSLFVVILLLINTGLFGQQGNRNTEVLECIEQYFALLEEQFVMGESSRPVSERTDRLCKRLNADLSLCPFKPLYVDCPKLGPSSALYSFKPDCDNKDFEIPIGEYLFHYATASIRNRPKLVDLCILSIDPKTAKVHYRSRNELLISGCRESELDRIAYVKFDGKDAFISEIRWATKDEIANSCLSQLPEPDELSASGASQVQTLQAQIVKLQNQINRMTEERSSLEQKGEQLAESIQSLEQQSKLYRQSIDSLREELKVSGVDLKNTRSKLDRAEGRLQDNLEKQEALKDSINSRWLRYRVQYSGLNAELSNISTQYLNVVSYYQKYAYSKTYFLGLNYGLIQAPYSQISLEELSIDPIRRSFNSEEFEYNFGLSVYHKIGGFVSGVRINPSYYPEVSYTQLFVDQVKEELFITGKKFTDLTYASSSHNLKAFNLGVYLHLVSLLNSRPSQDDKKVKLEESPLLNGFFLTGGISYLKGHVWDYYDGDFAGVLERDQSTGLYVIDEELVSSTGAILGLAYVKPYFQVELGYNTLYRDYFFNIGANFPITSKPRQGEPVKLEVKEVKELRNSLNQVQKTLKSIQ